MLNLLDKSDKYLKGLVLSRVPDLWTKRKNERLLVVNGNLGTWTVLDEQFQGFYKKLQKPVLYPDFIANDEGIPPAMYVSFMENLFSKCMLLLSGSQSDFSGAAKLTAPSTPRLFYLNFTRNSSESCNYFAKLIEKRFQVDKSEIYNFHLSGDFSVNSDGFFDFIGLITTKAEECCKKVSFSVEADSSKNTYPEIITELPLTLEYSLKITPGFFKDNDKKSDLKNALSHIAKIQNMGLRTGVKAALYEPESLSPLMNELLKNDISNIALKIAPETYLSDLPIVKSIKMMESFGYEYIKMLDAILPSLLYSHKRLILRDVHRFLFSMTGYDTPYPCNFSPCGMGEQVIFAEDNGYFYACRYMEKSKEKLSLNISDMNCPSASEKLQFWKTNRVEDSSQCRRCPWKRFCGGGCPVLTYEKHESLNREDPRCRFFKVMFENLIWKYYDSPLIVRKLGGLI